MSYLNVVSILKYLSKNAIRLQKFASKYLSDTKNGMQNAVNVKKYIIQLSIHCIHIFFG